jgi:hypothetical protein
VNQTLPSYALVGALLLTISIELSIAPPDHLSESAKIAFVTLMHSTSESKSQAQQKSTPTDAIPLIIPFNSLEAHATDMFHCHRLRAPNLRSLKLSTSSHPYMYHRHHHLSADQSARDHSGFELSRALLQRESQLSTR